MIPINTELHIIRELLEQKSIGSILFIKGIYPLLREAWNDEITSAYNEQHNQSSFNAYLERLKSEVQSDE
ncbi:MAG: hypothetical protein U9O94_08640 [Nanoarchaeota archaeon]|nr:hypothetical protein [Nanoarchaeota archaeon]